MLTEYPFWITIICILIAAAGAWLLYWFNPVSVSGKYAPITQKILTGFRFVSIFFISFLLVGPLIERITTDTQKPIVLFAVDNSMSMTIGQDSTILKQKLTDEITSLKNKLGNDFEVNTVTIGEDIKQTNNLTFTEKKSNLSALYTAAKNKYDGNNLSAIILASDGLYNVGENPLMEASSLRVPTYAIALGDTVQHKDVQIKNVRSNLYVFKNNTFPVQVDVAAFAASGNTTTIKVIQNGKVVSTQQLVLSENYFKTITFELATDENEIQHIIIEASALSGEISLANNRADVFIQVLNNKQKIALIAYAPHPDIAAYKKAISHHQQYTLDVFIATQNQSPSKIDDYNLVIFHQLPSWNGIGMNQIRNCKEKEVPILYILGAQTNIGALNQIEPNMAITGNRGNFNEALPVFQNDFSLFTLTEEEKEQFKKYPPLITPYGNYAYKGAAETLFKQQIGYVKTDYPLILFAKGEKEKNAFIMGEGFWKWYLHDKAISEHKNTSTLIGNITQYLTGKKNKNRFRLNHKNELDEGEQLQFTAELYNDNYQLVNTPEVSLQIKDSKGKSYPFLFTRMQDNYSLNAGTFESGKYTYEAKAKLGNTEFSKKGQFIIKPMQLEFAQTKANHQLLQELAVQSAGKLFHINTMDKLAEEIQKNESIKPIIYEHKEIKSWIDIKWIFYILLSLLSIEWFIRKWNGSL